MLSNQIFRLAHFRQISPYQRLGERWWDGITTARDLLSLCILNATIIAIDDVPIQEALRTVKLMHSVSSIGARINAAVKRAGIRRRNPYHTRHTFACWLLSAGANPSFIASQMGHENAQMVYEIYGAWIEEMNQDQIGMLNDRLAL